ncbi:hypothetical protein C8J56DRAFT_1046614 [Mycena floridula]|nr:hypothetical protein C8J56DRAFT_1046614 [Mycena floridula]
METNTVSCGGFPGVSDAFAAALWGIDYSMQLAYSNFSSGMFHVSVLTAFYTSGIEANHSGGRDESSFSLITVISHLDFVPPPSNAAAEYHAACMVYNPAIIMLQNITAMIYLYLGQMLAIWPKV